MTSHPGPGILLTRPPADSVHLAEEEAAVAPVAALVEPAVGHGVLDRAVVLVRVGAVGEPAVVDVGAQVAVEAGDFLGFLPEMVRIADQYFKSRQEIDRQKVKDIIKEIRFRERESDDVEKAIMIKLGATDDMLPKTFFMMIRLVETTGDIADHLENAADMMRAMIAR